MHGDKTYNVELVFDKEVATVVKERKYHKTAKIKEQKNGAVVLTMMVDSIDQLLPWVLSFGSKVKVKKPKELKEWLKDEIKKLNKTYMGR